MDPLAKGDFYWYCHIRNTTNPKYLYTFKNKVLVIDSYGRSIVNDQGLDKK